MGVEPAEPYFEHTPSARKGELRPAVLMSVSELETAGSFPPSPPNMEIYGRICKFACVSKLLKLGILKT